MAEDLWSHVAVAASLPCQLELRVQVIPRVLVHWQRLAQPEICQLYGSCVKDQALPAPSDIASEAANTSQGQGCAEAAHQG